MHYLYFYLQNNSNIPTCIINEIFFNIKYNFEKYLLYQIVTNQNVVIVSSVFGLPMHKINK